jgi:hypothetical protein
VIAITDADPDLDDVFRHTLAGVRINLGALGEFYTGIRSA